MSDREALAAALELLYEPNPDEQGRNTTPVRYPLDVIGAAARERLAQLPEKVPCPVAMVDEPHDCPGYKLVYPAELVERIKALGFVITTERAVLVLDALNGETE